MEPSAVISLITGILVSSVMITIGIVQLRSKKPVSFYTGEKPLREDELTDVKAWNRKHGLMWLSYGIFVLLCYLFGCIFLYDNVWVLAAIFGSVLIPLLLLVIGHHCLVKRYRKHKTN